MRDVRQCLVVAHAPCAATFALREGGSLPAIVEADDLGLYGALALDYLPGSTTFDTVANPPTAELASAIVWLDAFVSNVDRTARNPNMLTRHRRLWLIDHGAALYFHHAGGDYRPKAREPFARGYSCPQYPITAPMTAR